MSLLPDLPPPGSRLVVAWSGGDTLDAHSSPYPRHRMEWPSMYQPTIGRIIGGDWAAKLADIYAKIDAATSSSPAAVAPRIVTWLEAAAALEQARKDALNPMPPAFPEPEEPEIP